jgi:hypothetical protein
MKEWARTELRAAAVLLLQERPMRARPMTERRSWAQRPLRASLEEVPPRS